MPKFYSLRILDRQQETPDCISLSFEVPEALRETFQYQSGQYLTFRAEINGKEVRRSYSLCSAPHENEWRVAIKRVVMGVFSGYAHDKLHVGQTVEVMPPMGSFTLPDEPVRQVVCFAAGSGITPILGISKSVLERDNKAQVSLFYGNKSSRDIIFQEQLEGLKNTSLTRLSLYHILSREHVGVELFYGRLDAEKCTAFAKTLFNPLEVDHYYLCGPEQMIRSISEALTAAGVAKEKIHFELFGAPKPAPQTQPSVRRVAKQADLSKVSITVDGITTVIDMLDDGNHILEAGMAYGLDLPFACKGGVCSTCKCKVLAGEVAMEVNYALEPDEVAAGFVLSCQAHPISDEVAVTFDV